MSRRCVLKGIAAGGATVAVAGTGVLSYRVLDNGLLAAERSRALDPWRAWPEADGPLGAVAAAVLAANPHNAQPWAFRVSDTEVEVFADTARRTGALDPAGREMRVGLGCAIENLVLAARARGLAPTVTLLPDGSGSDLVARVALVEATPDPSRLCDAIGERRTNRGPYSAEAVPAGDLRGLVNVFGLPGVAVVWVTDADAKAALGRLMVDAATAITRDEAQSTDGFAWFRASQDDIERHRDGLTLDAQGMSPVLLSVAKLLPASSRAAGDAFWVAQTRDVHTRTAAAYGVITVTDPYDTTTQLIGGRLLQRIHLTATGRNLGLHHMNQITERIDRERAVGAPATFAPRFAGLLPPGAQPLAAFRVGYPLRAARPSPRRPVSAVIR
jgi:hypothetical protein